jgi:hypothetical protein
MSGNGQPGFLFNTGAAGRCDDYKVGGAMMRWNPVLNKFCIWYYGRSTDFPEGMAPALGSGSVALTTSDDGLNWERYDGPLKGGAVMAPNVDPNAFDSVHLGTGDIEWRDGQWHMWYYAGDDGTPNSANPTYRHPGYNLHAGLAVSDDGINWQRRPGKAFGGAIVGIGEEIYGAFPNVYQLGERTILQVTIKDKDFKGWITRVWSSEDLENWDYLGPLTWSDDPRYYDSNGVITRHVLPDPGGAGAPWMMIYTAVDGRPEKKQQRTIAVAVSDDGLSWRRQFDGPVFVAAEAGAWDDYNVANPQLCVRGDELWMTYFGFADPAVPGAAALRGIGLAVSKTGDLRSFERINA